ncbi:MAG TPA: tetratricopeptide repeat protein [Pyrinomonadaceae bacterium]|jgi:TonB family protein|nr:tetratricopeptide repeat protein [Pyrinomonadaceae bacterium]
MRELFIALAMSLVWIGFASAQTNGSRPAYAIMRGATPQTPAAQPPELAEADRLNKQVVQLHKEEKYDEALPLAIRVVEIRERALGPEHKLVALALFNLAELYLAKRKYGTAEPLYKRALSILEKTAGPDDANVSNILNSLALVRFMARDFEESEGYYQRVVAIREKAFGSESMPVARALYNLAELYRLLSRYEKAEPLYERIIAIEEKLLRDNDPELEKSFERYTCLLLESGKEKEAEALYERQRRKIVVARDPFTSDEILNGKAIKLPRPEYPEKARLFRAFGVVRVKVKIDESGTVIKAEATCGHPYLRETSEAAALKARFTPTLVRGKPVEVIGIITYNFIPPKRGIELR